LITNQDIKVYVGIKDQKNGELCVRLIKNNIVQVLLRI